MVNKVSRSHQAHKYPANISILLDVHCQQFRTTSSRENQIPDDEKRSTRAFILILLQQTVFTFLTIKNSHLEHACHDTMQGYEEEFDYIMDANIAAAQGLSRQYMNNRFESRSWPGKYFSALTSARFGCTAVLMQKPGCLWCNLYPFHFQLEALFIASEDWGYSLGHFSHITNWILHVLFF